MKVESFELRVSSCLKKLFTVHCPRFISNKLQTPNSELRTNNSGFTLIEVVLIIVVVSIAVPVLLIVLGSQAKSGVDAELRVVAANLAQDIMEGIINSPFSEITIATNQVITNSVGNISFTIYNTVCFVNGVNPDVLNDCVGYSTDYKKISLNVTAPANWDSSVELVTLRTDY